MKKYSGSRQLVKNTSSFLNIQYYSFFHELFKIKGIFYGWGRKKSGQEAIVLAKQNNSSYVLLEDGFIRSIGLGVDGSPSFSLVEDDLGIYYDATCQSKLENILNSYNFHNDKKLMDDARKAIALIKEHSISKYNNAPNFPSNYFDTNEERVLIIAQTAGDSSLEYGMLDEYSTDDMIDAAIDENPHAKIYLKIHPDVITGKKKSDIDIAHAKERCIVMQENYNPISLLKYFKKVYTKTSGMGFEALLVGCECVCFGMPYYAGWGITEDRSTCQRRQKQLNIQEVFAAAYILYTRYYNQYTKQESDIFDTIKTIVKLREEKGIV